MARRKSTPRRNYVRPIRSRLVARAFVPRNRNAIRFRRTLRSAIRYRRGRPLRMAARRTGMLTFRRRTGLPSYLVGRYL